MEKIHALSKEYGFHIIEDASHAIGGKYQSDYVGSCKYSDITVLVFILSRLEATAEGGMAALIMQPWHRRWICLEVMGLPVIRH